MSRIALLRIALVALVGVAVSGSPASGRDDGGAVPIFGIKIFPGYRDWRLDLRGSRRRQPQRHSSHPRQ